MDQENTPMPNADANTACRRRGWEKTRHRENRRWQARAATRAQIARWGLLAITALLLGGCLCRLPPAPPTAPAAATRAAATRVAARQETPPVAPTPTAEQAIAERWLALDRIGGGSQTGLAPHPADPNIVYMASDNGGLLKTEDGGERWFSVSSNLGAYRLGSVTLDPLDPEVIYVTARTTWAPFTSGENTGEIHRSRNGGRSWAFVTDAMGLGSSSPKQRAMVIPYDPADPERFDRDGDALSDVILVGALIGPAGAPLGGVWRSVDQGESFEHLALADKNVMALRAFEGDPDLLFLTTYEGQVYRSPDLGETWADISGDLPPMHLADLAVHPADSQVLYVTCRGCEAGKRPVWKTEDGGGRWVAAGRGLDSETSSAFPSLLIDRFDPQTLYVSTFDSQRGVYQSTDGGRRWRPMPARLVLPDGRPYYWLRFQGGLAIEQAVDGRLYAVGGGGWRYPAADGKKEWEPATIGVGNVRVEAIAVDPSDPAVVYQGIADFGPYKSVDRGASFHRILGTGWPVTVENFVWNGPYYRNYVRCELPCSETCTERGQVSTGGTTDFAISSQNPAIVYSSFGSGSSRSLRGGVNKSTDGGRTWQALGLQLEHGFELDPDTCLPYGFRHLAIDPSDDRVLYAVQELPVSGTARAYKTADGGLTWSVAFDASSLITGIDVSSVEPGLVVLTTVSDVLKSEQGGAPGSWQSVKPPHRSRLQTVALSPHRATVYVVGTSHQGIFYTSDGGANWINNDLGGFFAQHVSQDDSRSLDPEVATAHNPNLEVQKNIVSIVFDPAVEDTFYVGAYQSHRASPGIARITHAGQKWERLPLDGLAHRNVFTLAIDGPGQYLYAGGHDGTYRFRLR